MFEIGESLDAHACLLMIHIIQLKKKNQVWQKLVTTKTSSLHIPLSQTGRQHCFQRLNEVLTVCNQSISSMQDHGLQQLWQFHLFTNENTIRWFYRSHKLANALFICFVSTFCDKTIIFFSPKKEITGPLSVTLSVQPTITETYLCHMDFGANVGYGYVSASNSRNSYIKASGYRQLWIFLDIFV